MKPRLTALLTLFLVVALLAGCAAKKADRGSRTLAVEKQVMVAATPAAAPAAEAPAATSGYGGEASNQAKADDTTRMIIYTSALDIVVEDTDKTLEQLMSLAKDYKGYIADSRKWYQDEQAFASVTLRVPAESLTEVLVKVRTMAYKVESESNGGQDVTEEYTDLDARLRNLETAEKELLALETEIRENKGKAEDILAVHREVTNLRGEIEQLKGRMQYLERMTALATITLQIRPKAAPKPVVEKNQWNPLVTISEAARSFVGLLQVLASVVIYIVIFSPVVLVPVAILWGIAALIRRGKKAKKASSPPTAR